MIATRATRSRIIAITIALLLFVGAWHVWSRFMGNPIVMLGLRGQVMRYLDGKYPPARFEYLGGAYNFMDGTYGAGLRSSDDPGITFSVRREGDQNYTDDYEESRLDHEAGEALAPLVHDALPGATVLAHVLLPTGESPADVHFSAALRADVSAAIGWERSDTTKQEFVRTALAILRILREQGYSLSSCNFWCELGEREYALQLDNTQMQLNEAELVKLVAQPGKW